MPTKLKKWKKINRRLLFKNNYFKLYEDTVLMPSGKRYNYYINNPHSIAALILPFDEQGRVLISREYRHPVGKIILNSIGGTVEKGETPLQAARRELHEETGYRAKNWKLLGKIYGNPARSGVVFYLYKATHLNKGQDDPEQNEFIENVWLPIEKFERMILKGQIMEPYLYAMYLLAKLGKK